MNDKRKQLSQQRHSMSYSANMLNVQMNLSSHLLLNQSLLVLCSELLVLCRYPVAIGRCRNMLGINQPESMAMDCSMMEEAPKTNITVRHNNPSFKICNCYNIRGIMIREKSEQNKSLSRSGSFFSFSKAHLLHEAEACELRPCSDQVPVPGLCAWALKRMLFRLLGAQGAIVFSFINFRPLFCLLYRREA